MNKITPTKKLIALAEIFGDYAKLFMVGGFVRNSLMGLPCYDMDITSSLTPDKVLKLIENTPYKAVSVHKVLGTLQIISGKEIYEYTTFRYDNYSEVGGQHIPNNVVFTDDIMMDCKRRDFRTNAIYYDILTGELFDPLHGIKDIENRILRTTVEASKVFSEDGLRILRLVRFAAELDYDIEAECLRYATINSYRLRDIAVERICIECKKILNSDIKYGLNKYAHIKGLELLDKISASEIVFKGLSININRLRFASSGVRYALLLADNDIVMVAEYLKEMRFSNKEQRNIMGLIRLLTADIGNKKKIIKVLVNNSYLDYGLMVEFLEKMNRPYQLIKKTIDSIKMHSLPTSIRELQVGGKELIKLNVLETQRTKILKKVLLVAIEHGATSYEEQYSIMREVL